MTTLISSTERVSYLSRASASLLCSTEYCFNMFWALSLDSCVCVCVCVCVGVCVCVCVGERERERECVCQPLVVSLSLRQ